MPEQGMKTCTKCGIEKSLSEFSKNRGHKDGLQSACKKCDAERSRLYRQNNLEKEKTRARKYKQIHRESEIIRGHKYYSEHRKGIIAKRKDYAQDNREAERAKSALYSAVKAGKIIRPDTCSNPLCDNTERIQGHHWSYDKEHLLDVIWSCCSCHKRIHLTGQAEKQEIDWSKI